MKGSRIQAGLATERAGDTQRAIDADRTLVKVYRGRTQQLKGEYWVRISISNNIPNRNRTASSASDSTEVTITAMPGTDLRAQDRVVDDKGQSYVVRFVPPGQEWQVEALATVEADGTSAN